MTRAELDALVSTYVDKVAAKQTAAFTKNGKYSQLLRSHDSVPTTVTAVNGSLQIDEDVSPDLAACDFAFRVDEYVTPSGEAGWAIGLWVVEEAVTYNKWFAFGPEAASFNADWVSTWDEELQVYGGP